MAGVELTLASSAGIAPGQPPGLTEIVEVAGSDAPHELDRREREEGRARDHVHPDQGGIRYEARVIRLPNKECDPGGNAVLESSAREPC
jgi:hypothetical protein